MDWFFCTAKIIFWLFHKEKDISVQRIWFPCFKKKDLVKLKHWRDTYFLEFSWYLWVICFFFQELHHRQSELADDQGIQNLGWSGQHCLDKIWNHPTSRKWRHVFQDGGHLCRRQKHLPQRFVSSIGNKDFIILSHLQLIVLFWSKYFLMTKQVDLFLPFMLINFSSWVLQWADTRILFLFVHEKSSLKAGYFSKFSETFSSAIKKNWPGLPRTVEKPFQYFLLLVQIFDLPQSYPFPQWWKGAGAISSKLDQKLVQSRTKWKIMKIEDNFSCNFIRIE